MQSIPAERPWGAIPAKGLLVKEPWISKLLSGEKTWELRGSATKLRGPAGMIGSRTGLVAGQADLVGCVGPLSRDDLAANVHLHRVEWDWAAVELPYRNVYAWVFADARRYDIPVPYSHPQGAVIWVDLRKSIVPANGEA